MRTCLDRHNKGSEATRTAKDSVTVPPELGQRHVERKDTCVRYTKEGNYCEK